MVEKLFIDGKDAFLEYGAFVEQYGYKALIQIPQFKKLDSTEWQEYDGEETDLTAPVLDTKTFSIPFCITDITGANDLFELLSDKAYHTFDFTEISRSYRLRLVSNPNLSSKIRLGKLSLNFADDFPKIDKEYPYINPANDVRQRGYQIDEIDFSRFGIYVLNGTDDNIKKAPNVRPNLTVDSRGIAGVIYDDEKVMYKTKDVTMKLLIRAEGIDTFWKRWFSFFHILTQPEERKLYIETTVEEFACYYKKSSVSKFEILRSGLVWCEFSVVLTFTDSRPECNYGLLATENDELVITETDDNYILLKRYD